MGVLALLAALAAYLVSREVLAVDTRGARVSHLTIQSRAVGKTLDVDIVLPAGAADGPARPLLVFLHGRSGSNSSYTSNDALFAALAKLGHKAPVIAFPDGDDDSYWHDRSDGHWGRYVAREVIPQVGAAAHTDPHRTAIGGISMGGFGAYDIALDHPSAFCAVGGHSPALWLRGGDTAPGAFDDAEDFARNDVVATVRADPGAFGAIPVWNDAGRDDPFLISDVAFSSALRSGGANLTARRWAGGHDLAYWDRHWGAYLGFYARALANCAA